MGVTDPKNSIGSLLDRIVDRLECCREVGSREFPSAVYGALHEWQCCYTHSDRRDGCKGDRYRALFTDLAVDDKGRNTAKNGDSQRGWRQHDFQRWC